VQVEAVSADVDQLTRHGIRVSVHGFPHGLIAAADRSQRQHPEHRVQQPASDPATQPSARTDEHPDHQRQQSRRPHPVQHLTDRAAEPDQEQTTHSHEHGGN
jgi:hypothetical protein